MDRKKYTDFTNYTDLYRLYKIVSLKNSNDTIGNPNRDLPVCSVVIYNVYFTYGNVIWKSEGVPRHFKTAHIYMLLIYKICIIYICMLLI